MVQPLSQKPSTEGAKAPKGKGLYRYYHTKGGMSSAERSFKIGLGIIETLRTCFSGGCFDMVYD